MFNSFAMRYQKYAPLFLRVGLGIVFFLFGLKKLMNPEQATSEIQLLMNFALADAAALNFYLGLIETMAALSFLIGFKVRTFALVAASLIILFLSSFLIKYGFSINPDLYRDIGLFGASIALFLLGAGPVSFDNRAKYEQIP